MMDAQIQDVAIIYSLPFYSSIFYFSMNLILGYFPITSLLHCSKFLISFLNQILDYNCRPGSKTPLTKSIPLVRIILLQTGQKMNIYFTKGKCMADETVASLNLLKSTIRPGVQLAVNKATAIWQFL